MQGLKLNISGWTGLCVIILLFCFCPKYILAQNEGAKQDSSYSNKDTVIQYLNPWEYAFMMHEETKWIFKAFLNVVFIIIYLLVFLFLVHLGLFSSSYFFGRFWSSQNDR